MQPLLLAVVVLAAAASALSLPAAASNKCDECKTVVKLVEVAIATNTTGKIIAALEGDCDKIFKAGTSADKLCRELSADVVGLLPEIEHQLDSLAWDELALCAALGKCQVPCCSTPAGPEQVHVALGDAPGEMTAQWATLDATATSVVQYGPNATGLVYQGLGSNTTYTNFGWVGQLHRATMARLAPGTRYYYRVGDLATNTFSPVYSFRTLPAALPSNASATPLRVVWLGDMGYGPNSDTTVKALQALVEQDAVDLVIHNGDIGYADGDMQHWDTFLRKIEPVAASVPYMTSPGNHEFWFNFTAYKKRFSMPGSLGWQESMFYAFNISLDVRFVAIDTESEADVAYMSPHQIAWVKQTLEQTPHPTWLITYGHRPLYCSNHGGQDIPGGEHVLRALAEDMFVKNKVDLAVQSHMHGYERSFPMVNGKPTSTNYSSPSAPVYVVNGAGGNREKNELPPGGEPWSPTDPGAVSGAVSYGLMKLTTSSLEWQQINSADGSVIDTFTITK